MSDDEEQVAYVRRTKVLHYGSLEEQERKRLASGVKTSLSERALNHGIESGHINISDGEIKALISIKLFTEFRNRNGKVELIV